MIWNRKFRLEFTIIRIGMQENQLYALWQALGRSGQWVHDGRHTLRVIDPGTLNLSFGPDFTGSRFDLDGTRIYGDVEMHLKQVDWYRHQHHLNPFYQNVALHVVLAPSEEPAQVLSRISQRSIPSFFLDANTLPQMARHPALQCRPQTILPGAKKILQELALKRFQAKVRALFQQLETVSLAQLFYESFLRTLGYPGNAAPFQLLAQRLPVAWLERQTASPFTSFRRLYALYAGQAGFLSLSPPDDYTHQLKTLYEEQRAMLPSEGLLSAMWRFSGVRAVNHPHFRLAAWVALLQKAKDLPFEGMYGLFAARQPYQKLLQQLTAYFQIPVTGYWQTHYRLSAKAVRKGPKFYFGRARLFELLINTLIPVMAVRALQSQSEGFLSYLQNFYLWLPSVTPYRSLSCYFSWWEAYHKLWSAQAFWQSILQLDDEFCRAGACAQCPLRHKLDKKQCFD